MQSPLPFTLEDVRLSTTTWLTLTNQCNINCKYCFNYVERNNQHMSADLAVNLVKSHYEYLQGNLNSSPYLNILFFGGEPTGNPDAIFAVMDYLEDADVKSLPLLLTNGIIQDALLEKLMARNMFFQISFDGLRDNVRLSKTGEDTVNAHTIKTIAKLSEHKIPMNIRATIHEDNVQHMSELIELVAEYNIESISFLPIFKNGNALKNNLNAPTIKTYLENLNLARSQAERLNVRLVIGETSFSGKLAAGPYRPPLVWLPDGTLALTIKYASTKEAIAHHAIIGKYDAENHVIKLDDIKLKSFADNFVNIRKKFCAGCSIFNSCQGLRRLDDFFLELDSFSEQEYFCDIARELLSGAVK